MFSASVFHTLTHVNIRLIHLEHIRLYNLIVLDYSLKLCHYVILVVLFLECVGLDNSILSVSSYTST